MPKLTNVDKEQLDRNRDNTPAIQAMIQRLENVTLNPKALNELNKRPKIIQTLGPIASTSTTPATLRNIAAIEELVAGQVAQQARLAEGADAEEADAEAYALAYSATRESAILLARPVAHYHIWKMTTTKNNNRKLWSKTRRFPLQLGSD
jgi:hypothetical protein